MSAGAARRAAGAGGPAPRPVAARAPARAIRVDLQLIADMIPAGARLLDVGCGDGALLDYLVGFKQVDGRGIELSQEGVNACVRNGLPVIQGDADTDLGFYPDASFDYVVLTRTLQAVYDPLKVLTELVRIGRHAIVSIPNFGHWRVRLQLLAQGRMPVTGILAEPWYSTPNIHLCTIRDFLALCRERSITIDRGITLDSDGRPWRLDPRGRFANLFSAQGIFLLRRAG